jgi:hypothetical protein
MKQIIKIFALCFFLGIKFAQGQTFEGIIQWKMEMQMTGSNQKMPEITPEQKAQMEQMMKDPQMKVMIESNPQMKAQMEMMKKISSGGGMNDMFPKGFIIKLKDGNSLVIMDGGMMGHKEILTIPSKKERITIDRKAKTFSKKVILDTKSNKADVKLIKTDEFITIAGYKSRKYLVEKIEMGKKVVSEVYTTTEVSGVDMEAFKKMSMGESNESFYVDGMEGIPMKMKIKNQQGSLSMEAVSVTKKVLPSSDFSIPSGFTETKSDY